MRSNQIFAAMTGEEALHFLEGMREEAPPVAEMALAAAAEAFRLRPDFLKRQPRPRQAEWVRRALGRTIGAGLAEEVLATYFLDHRQELLVELLDTLGVEHEEGRLTNPEPSCPDSASLAKSVASFRKGDDRDTRDLLLRAFASQSSIDWPELDSLLIDLPAPAARARKTKTAKASATKTRVKKAKPKKAKAVKATAKKAKAKKSKAVKSGAKKA